MDGVGDRALPDGPAALPLLARFVVFAGDVIDQQPDLAQFRVHQIGEAGAAILNQDSNGTCSRNAAGGSKYWMEITYRPPRRVTPYLLRPCLLLPQHSLHPCQPNGGRKEPFWQNTTKKRPGQQSHPCRSSSGIPAKTGLRRVAFYE